MYISDQSALLVRHVRNVRVSRIKTGSCGIGITRVSGKDKVTSQVEESEMSPINRVKLLSMQQQMVGCGSRIELRREIRHVRNPLLFIYHQILNDPQVLSCGLLY